MIFSLRSTGRYVLVLICCLLQAGCAVKLPLSTRVIGNEREYIINSYQSLLKKGCETSIDADVSLELNTFGRHQKAAGFLQIKPPALLRATVVDPVGRPIFILVTAGKIFTLVDSMKGEGTVGSIESITREAGDPLFLQSSEVISLLRGRMMPAVTYLQDVHQDKQTSELVWLIFSPYGENHHNVLFNPQTQRIERYVVDSKSGGILLDIDYTWDDVTEYDCPVPRGMKMSGAVFKGEISLKYDQVLQNIVIPEHVFELTLPKHYKIKYVE